jgi:apolipoprotein N-acyltransferase
MRHETMASLRSPVALFAGFFVFVSIPLVAMWLAVGDLTLLARFGGFALYFLVAHVALPAWVYLDARPSPGSSAVAWTVVTFLIPFVGALVYLLVVRARREASSGS